MDPCAFLATFPCAAIELAVAEFCTVIIRDYICQVYCRRIKRDENYPSKWGPSIDRLTVEMDRGCFLKLSAASYHLWHFETASSADRFRVALDPSQAYFGASGFAVLSASGHFAMRSLS